MTVHILLIEHTELKQIESLVPSLEACGYQTVLAHTPQAAVEKIETHWPNLVIFNPSDSQLEVSSFEKAINKTKLDIPYLLVGDQNHLTDEANNKTIITEPHDPEQLNYSIKKALSKQKNRFIRLPNLIIDRHQYQLLRNEQKLSLTPKEFKLLHLLVTYHDQILSRKIIMQEVWETDYMGDTRTLDVHIRWLREKIEENPSYPRRLITVRGVGYRFIVQESE